MEEIKKGTKLKIKLRNGWHEGYISRVYKTKCFFEFDKCESKWIQSGRWSLMLEPLKKSIYEGKYAFILKEKDNNSLFTSTKVNKDYTKVK